MWKMPKNPYIATGEKVHEEFQREKNAKKTKTRPGETTRYAVVQSY